MGHANVPSLDHAVEAAAELRRALDQEVFRAQGERDLIRRFDTDALFQRASARTAWNAEMVRLQARLALALRHVGDDLGLAEVTIEGLQQKLPTEASSLVDVLSEVRARAEALKELDELNRSLAERASACAKGYLQALSLTSSGYDRRGKPGTVPASTYSGSA